MKRNCPRHCERRRRAAISSVIKGIASSRFTLLAMTVSCSLVLSSPVYAQGVFKGRVVFQGTPPVAESIEVKSDTPICGTHKELPKIVLGQNQGVANAVVRILGAKAELKPKDGALDQAQCEFVPHVQVIPVGSKVVITSSDSVLHNAHGFYEDGSTAFNIAVPVVGMEIGKKLDKPGLIKLRCDAGHTWMKGFIYVVDGPFYTLTDADGNFSIEGVPPGHYDVEVWQEWLGKTRQGVDIKEGASKPSTVTLREANK